MSYSTKTIKALKEIDSLIKGAAVHDMARFDELMVQIDDIEVLTKLKNATTKEGGWVFCGADFASLEDRISALTTRDPMKLKVYAGSKQYDITINGVTHRIREEDVVSYDGVEMTGEELYEKFQNS